MKIADIEKFLARKSTKTGDYVKISFKGRGDLFGLFIQQADYTDLKEKNFWRVVPQSQLAAYNLSKSASLSRLYSGDSFSRLSSYEASFE